MKSKNTHSELPSWNYHEAFSIEMPSENCVSNTHNFHFSELDEEDPEDCLTLGRMFTRGLDVKKSRTTAIRYYQKSAQMGSSDAQYELAKLYENDLCRGVPLRKAIKYYLLAAKSGHPAALYKVGECYLIGACVPQSFEIALQHFERAAENGSLSAYEKLSEIYACGIGVSSSPQKKSRYLQKLFMILRRRAKSGDLTAQLRLGDLFLNGKGCKKSPKKAFHLFCNIVSDEDEPIGKLHLAYCYLRGNGVRQSIETAETLFEELYAFDKHKYAYALASFLIDYDRNVKRGIAILKKIALGDGIEDSHKAASLFDLGSCYEQGVGVPKSERLAKKFYHMSAFLLYMPGVARVGEMLLTGTLGVNANPVEGVKAIRMAALGGNSESWLVLARCFLKGIGIKKSYEGALYCLQIAKRYGYSVDPIIKKMWTIIKKSPSLDGLNRKN